MKSLKNELKKPSKEGLKELTTDHIPDSNALSTITILTPQLTALSAELRTHVIKSPFEKYLT